MVFFSSEDPASQLAVMEALPLLAVHSAETVPVPGPDPVLNPVFRQAAFLRFPTKPRHLNLKIASKQWLNLKQRSTWKQQIGCLVVGKHNNIGGEEFILVKSLLLFLRVTGRVVAQEMVLKRQLR